MTQIESEETPPQNWDDISSTYRDQPYFAQQGKQAILDVNVANELVRKYSLDHSLGADIIALDIKAVHACVTKWDLCILEDDWKTVGADPQDKSQKQEFAPAAAARHLYQTRFREIRKILIENDKAKEIRFVEIKRLTASQEIRSPGGRDLDCDEFMVALLEKMGIFYEKSLTVEEIREADIGVTLLPVKEAQQMPMPASWRKYCEDREIPTSSQDKRAWGKQMDLLANALKYCNEIINAKTDKIKPLMESIKDEREKDSMDPSKIVAQLGGFRALKQQRDDAWIARARLDALFLRIQRKHNESVSAGVDSRPRQKGKEVRFEGKLSGPRKKDNNGSSRRPKKRLHLSSQGSKRLANARKEVIAQVCTQIRIKNCCLCFCS